MDCNAAMTLMIVFNWVFMILYMYMNAIAYDYYSELENINTGVPYLR